MSFSQTGWQDLAASLSYGAGGVNELLQRNQRLYFSRWTRHLALDCSLLMPWFAQTVKWLLYLASGCLFAAALHFARPVVPVLERPLQVRGFHLAREFLFGLGFLPSCCSSASPFVQESQRMDFPLRLRLPVVGSVLPAAVNNNYGKIMNQLSLLTLLLFFVLQALIYTACVVKLAEIRRQKVPPRIKLRLLENEDHLFDAGLYLGLSAPSSR